MQCILFAEFLHTYFLEGNFMSILKCDRVKQGFVKGLPVVSYFCYQNCVSKCVAPILNGVVHFLMVGLSTHFASKC